MDILGIPYPKNTYYYENEKYLTKLLKKEIKSYEVNYINKKGYYVNNLFGITNRSLLTTISIKPLNTLK